MLRRSSALVVFVLVAVNLPAPAAAQAPVSYRLSFPEPEHRWMQVDVAFDDLPAATLELRMSRTSPGRYARHEFAKNVFDVRVTDASGAALPVDRPNPHQWNVSGHGGRARVSYRVFGDRIDGTYLAIDSTHAHINMPAALLWARGLERRAATIRFDPPAGSNWRVATQLFRGADEYSFTAPNLQYLMDSPAELSAFVMRTFSVDQGADAPLFRVAIHHAGIDADVDGFVPDVERIVREARHVFGEYPAFEEGTYTFIADYLPWANGDGMEHRNSTIVTSPSSIRSNRFGLLDTIAHEFFHVWNVERIRPRSLEPFNFDEANMSGELWFAEGFTSYYGPLVLVRAGVTQLADFVAEITDTLNTVLNSPGRLVRSAEEMSRMAPFVDAAVSIDRTSFENTYISYYAWGEAIALGLDLALRDRSDGAITLDHFMRELWRTYGKPGGSAPGLVDHPYTHADLRRVLAGVARDPSFADGFFDRFVQGREVVDYERLLDRAGFVVRPAAPGQGFAGLLRLQDGPNGARVVGSVPFGSPAYAAGLERDDVITAVDGRAVQGALDVELAIRAHKPGDEMAMTFERRGQRVSARIGIVADPRLEVVPVESTGRPFSADQRRFRDAWLSSGARNTF